MCASRHTRSLVRVYVCAPWTVNVTGIRGVVESANRGPSSNGCAPIDGQECSRMRATVTTGCTLVAGSGDGLRVRHRLRARAHPRSSLLAFGVGRVSRSRVLLSHRQLPGAHRRVHLPDSLFLERHRGATTPHHSSFGFRLGSVPIQPRSVPTSAYPGTTSKEHRVSRVPIRVRDSPSNSHCAAVAWSGDQAQPEISLEFCTVDRGTTRLPWTAVYFVRFASFAASFDQ